MTRPKTGTPAWVLPAGLGVLVIGLVTIALLRGPVSLDPDTAEGTVQEYLLAISEERWDDAIEVVHEDWRGACAGEDLESFAETDLTAELGDRTGFAEARFESFDEEGTEMTIPEEASRVAVTINHDSPGDFGAGWREGVEFRLVDGGEFWWLVGDPWPYFVWSCRDGR